MKRSGDLQWNPGDRPASARNQAKDVHRALGTPAVRLWIFFGSRSGCDLLQDRHPDESEDWVVGPVFFDLAADHESASARDRRLRVSNREDHQEPDCDVELRNWRISVRPVA